jgi:hypothetical protein
MSEEEKQKEKQKEEELKRIELWEVYERFKLDSNNIDKELKKKLNTWNYRLEDKLYYDQWLELYRKLRNFCSGYSDGEYLWHQEKNDGELIRKYWLRTSLNNIYRRCLMLSDNYHEWKITWKEYYHEMYKMFQNMESTISHSQESGFYPIWETRNMPELSGRD